MTNNDSGDEWAQELVRRVGLAAKALRGKRSAKWLSDRTAELGYPISPQVIAKLDSGKRGAHLQVAELMVLAYALNTSPAMLLFPDAPGAPVELVPGVHVESLFAADWLGGLEGDQLPEVEKSEWFKNVKPLTDGRIHQSLVRNLEDITEERAKTRREWLENRDDKVLHASVRAADEWLRLREAELLQARGRLRADGRTPPALSEGTAYLDEGLDDA